MSPEQDESGLLQGMHMLRTFSFRVFKNIPPLAQTRTEQGCRMQGAAVAAATPPQLPLPPLLRCQQPSSGKKASPTSAAPQENERDNRESGGAAATLAAATGAANNTTLGCSTVSERATIVRRDFEIKGEG